MPSLVPYREGMVGVCDMDAVDDAIEDLMSGDSWRYWWSMNRDLVFELNPPYWCRDTPSEVAYARYRLLRRQVHSRLGGTSLWGPMMRLLTPAEFAKLRRRYDELAPRIHLCLPEDADPFEVLECRDIAERLLLPYEEFDDPIEALVDLKRPARASP